jgi:ectoine hydroxylase-related dioxygenase (phytanoyl-CoA dioxygenase family)
MPSLLDTPYPVTDEQVARYQRDGFISISNILHGPELARLRDAVAAAVADETVPTPRGDAPPGPYEQIFIQKVNLWRRHETIREFVTCRRFGDLAARLSGHPARVWHDQALFKVPREGAKTPWHQDAHYWPHVEKGDQITIWIALKDATTANGCMSFIPGSQTVKTLEPISLADPQNIFDLAPDFRGIKPTTCELTAGSCTFHNGLTFHYAGPNKSDTMREAFAILYMPDGTHYSGRKHIVTDPLNLSVNDKLEGEMFPLVGS